MDGATPEEINTRANALQEEIYAEAASIINNYREGITTNDELQSVKEYYYKKKYLDRLLKPD